MENGLGVICGEPFGYKNAIRLTRLVKFLSEQKVNIIISANITSMQFRKWCRKNIKNYYEIILYYSYILL